MFVTVYLKLGYFEFVSASCVKILYYLCLTIQLVMLRVFELKVKNLAFDISKIIANDN